MRRLAPSTLLLGAARAQSAANLAAFAGLAPVAALPTTEAGRAALAANLRITATIQTGARMPPLLLPFAFQQAQALRDAFITGLLDDGSRFGLYSRLDLYAATARALAALGGAGMDAGGGPPGLRH